jgi:DNA-binding NarL/FixJ family response regulator
MIKVLLVDDDKLILQSLKITLSKEPDIEVIGTLYDGREALGVCKDEIPDIILMDIQMPNIDGIETTRLIKEHFPNVLIMMLTTFADQAHIKDAMAVGASGYLLKTDPLSNLANRLRMLHEGTGIMSIDALNQLTLKENPALKMLTPRELEIARLVAQGLSNKEIAAELFLSEGTVRNNLVIIMEKMEVNNRLQLCINYYI